MGCFAIEQRRRRSDLRQGFVIERTPQIALPLPLGCEVVFVWTLRSPEDRGGLPRLYRPRFIRLRRTKAGRRYRQPFGDSGVL